MVDAFGGTDCFSYDSRVLGFSRKKIRYSFKVFVFYTDRMIRKILVFNYILFLFIFPVYSVEKEDREYTHLYLHPIELSEEVESTIDEFLVCNTRKVMNKHYLKISIFEANPDSVYYEIELINSPDEKKLVIDEKIFGSWYEGIQPLFIYVGYSYYKGHWIIVSKWYQLQDMCNPFIEKSSSPFVEDFLLWKHEVIPNVGVDNSGVCFIVKKNYIYTCPPMMEE